MRLLPRSWPTTSALATGGTALAVLLMGTTAAVAAPAAATQQQGEAAGGTAPEPSATPTGCADELVTFHRDGTMGDDRAVAITAQALQRGVGGWQRLGWQAGTDTTLRLVVATGVDGEVRELPPTTTGMVEDVLLLTFCGRRDTSGEATAEPEPPAPTTEPEPPAPTTELSSEITEVDAEQEQLRRNGTQPPADDDPGPVATTGARQATTQPIEAADGSRTAAERRPTTESFVATSPATAPVTPVAGARTSAVLHAELVAATGRDGGWLSALLASLLAATGTGAIIAAARRSNGRAPRPAAPGVHEHQEAGR